MSNMNKIVLPFKEGMKGDIIVLIGLFLLLLKLLLLFFFS